MASSSSSSSCALEYDPRGRLPIGIVQQQTGMDYPLVAPSDDIKNLLADAYFTYDDPADYDDTLTPYAGELRITWLYGIGCVAASQPAGAPVPTHEADLVIKDSDDRTVFDSTTAASFSEREWGTRLHIYEWKTDDAVCRIVVHTKWPQNDEDPEPQQYSIHLEPTNAVLNPRVIKRRPTRVKSLQVVLTNMTAEHVDFRAGYNMELSHIEPVRDPGSRFRQQIAFAADPGTGLGVFPGCDPAVLNITRINNVRPTAAGDFFIGARDCYYARQPTTIVSSSPRLATPNTNLFPGNTLDVDLPGPDAGKSTSEIGWPASDIYGHMQLGNDCVACCTCEDYIDVAEYLNKVRNQYQALGISTEEVRDQYHDNRGRWKEALQCFHRKPLRVFVQSSVCPYLDFAIQFCNQTDECIIDLVLTVTFSTLPFGADADLIPGYGWSTGHAGAGSGRRSQSARSRYTLSGTYPTFTATWDSVDQFGSVDYRGRLKFGACGGVGADPDFEAFHVTATLTATVGGSPLIVVQADGSGTEAAESEASDALNCPAVEEDAIDLTECIPVPTVEESSSSA